MCTVTSVSLRENCHEASSFHGIRLSCWADNVGTDVDAADAGLGTVQRIDQEAPAFGERGRGLFSSWASQLLAAVLAKLLFSFLLGVMLAVLAVIAVCGLFVAGASAAQASGRTAAHGGPSTAGQVVVQSGDTLWSIAQGADPNADARTVVQEILQANRLTTASITAGQRLWVPRG